MLSCKGKALIPYRGGKIAPKAILPVHLPKLIYAVFDDRKKYVVNDILRIALIPQKLIGVFEHVLSVGFIDTFK